jgi:hypothetical protein
MLDASLNELLAEHGVAKWVARLVLVMATDECIDLQGYKQRKGDKNERARPCEWINVAIGVNQDAIRLGVTTLYPDAPA